MLKWLLAIGLCCLAYVIREQFTPFIVGMVIAYLLARPVALLGRHARFGRGWAVLFIYVAVLATFGVVAWKGMPIVAEQATSLFQHRAIIVGKLVQQISAATGWSPDVQTVTADALIKVQTFITAKPEELLAVGGLVSRSLIFVLIATVSSIYFLKDSSRIGAFLLRFVPENKRGECAEMVAEIDLKFSKYIVGQFLLMGIMAVLAFCILSFYHLKYALIVAIIAGVLEIIPVFGPLAALLLAATIAASQLGLQTGLIVAGLLWCARLFEDYVVIPRVIGHAVQLHPLVTIFVVLAGETIGGGLGMLLAVPAAAAAKVVLDHFYPPTKAELALAGGAHTDGPSQSSRIAADLQTAIKARTKRLADWLKSFSGE